MIDDSAPALPLVGDAPDPSTFQKLNRARAGGSSVVLGRDAAPYVAIPEPGHVIRVVPLAPRHGGDQVLMADTIVVRYRAFYLLTRSRPSDDTSGDGGAPDAGAATQLSLSIQSAGDDKPDAFFLFGPEPEALLIDSGGMDDAFVYWARVAATKSFEIHHREDTHPRRLPFPANLDPADASTLQRFLLSPDGRWLLVLDGENRLSVHATLSDDDRTFDPPLFDAEADFEGGYVVTYAPDGLRRHPIDPTVPDDALLLDGPPCRLGGIAGGVDGGAPGPSPPGSGAPPCPTAQPLYVLGRDVYYLVGDDLRHVDVRTPGTPTVALHGTHRLLAVGPHAQLAYSRDLASPEPAARYVFGASDGWLGDWNFMERGRSLRWSADGTKLRFLEHAAQSGGIGDLRSVVDDPVGKPTPRTLARNVRQYDELGDRRLLAVENHAFTGTQARLVAIDEQRGERRWVAAAAHRYQFIPGSSDLVVDVITGATGYDIYRVPVVPAPVDGGP